MPNKQKVSAEKKVQIVREYLNDRISIAEAARRVGRDKETVKGWVNIYENEGASGFIHQENRTYSVELKTAAVIDYHQGGGSLQTICRKYGIRDKHILRRWIKVYNAHGDFDSVKYSGGGSYMRKARSTTQEERLQIVRECLESGKNYGEMALKYNVSYQQVRTWTLKFEELGEAGLEDRRGKRKKDQEPRTELEAAQIEIERLKHELYLANMENHLLKKLDEIVRRDASDK
ncbi:MAG: transposase [Oscillospiraceae bacterium]|nr:transposase [Oscillospiraceae bacterium]